MKLEAPRLTSGSGRWNFSARLARTCTEGGGQIVGAWKARLTVKQSAQPHSSLVFLKKGSYHKKTNTHLLFFELRH